MQRQIGFAKSGKCRQEASDQASTLSRRDGEGRPLVAVAVGHRAVLPQGRASPTADWLGTDGADLFLQQWYWLSDEGLEDALYYSVAMRTFAGIDLAVENAPDATMLLKFRRLLVEHHLTRMRFDESGISLCERRLMMKEGTLVDAAIIEAPPSTRNAEKSRDSEMHQTKNGNEWHLGMKACIGVDTDSGLVHSVVGTAANVSDVSQAHALLFAWTYMRL